MKFCFGDIVVVDNSQIGVVIKSWLNNTHEVYVRNYDCIKLYREVEMERYIVRHKYLNEEELEYQRNAINGW